MRKEGRGYELSGNHVALLVLREVTDCTDTNRLGNTFWKWLFGHSSKEKVPTYLLSHPTPTFHVVCLLEPRTFLSSPGLSPPVLSASRQSRISTPRSFARSPQLCGEEGPGWRCRSPSACSPVQARFNGRSELV